MDSYLHWKAIRGRARSNGARLESCFSDGLRRLDGRWGEVFFVMRDVSGGKLVRSILKRERYSEKYVL